MAKSRPAERRVRDQDAANGVKKGKPKPLTGLPELVCVVGFVDAVMPAGKCVGGGALMV